MSAPKFKKGDVVFYTYKSKQRVYSGTIRYCRWYEPSSEYLYDITLLEGEGVVVRGEGDIGLYIIDLSGLLAI